MSKIIEVVIAPNGQTRIETRGYFGNACRDASRFLEQALGVQTSDTATVEAYQVTQQTAEQRNR